LLFLEGTRPKPKWVQSADDVLLTHYGRGFDEIAYLYNPAEKRYTWAHNLVSIHYSDEENRLHPPLPTLEKAAGIRLRESKFALKESDPKKWRHYPLGVWRRRQDEPEVAALYQSKLIEKKRNLLCQRVYVKYLLHNLVTIYWQKRNSLD
jgi:hypothetical protein